MWKRIEGLVEDNSSTKLGHLRSVYSVLTSCFCYPMFIHSFHSSNSRRSTGKINTQSMSLRGMRKYDELCTVSVNTRRPLCFFECRDSAVPSIFCLTPRLCPTDSRTTAVQPFIHQVPLNHLAINGTFS